MEEAPIAGTEDIPSTVDMAEEDEEISPEDEEEDEESYEPPADERKVSMKAKRQSRKSIQVDEIRIRRKSLMSTEESSSRRPSLVQIRRKSLIRTDDRIKFHGKYLA